MSTKTKSVRRVVYLWSGHTTHPSQSVGRKVGFRLRDLACPHILLAAAESTLNGHLGEIWRPNVEHGETLDFEAELCIVIGRRCRNVSPEESLEYVLGRRAGGGGEMGKADHP